MFYKKLLGNVYTYKQQLLAFEIKDVTEVPIFRIHTSELRQAFTARSQCQVSAQEAAAIRLSMKFV